MLRQLLAVAALTSLFTFNFIELNRRKMGPIEFVLWQTGILLLAAVAIFQDFGQKISSTIGFELLANFIFALVIVALLLLARIQSRQIGKLQKQLQDLVQATALKNK
jgi:hypothetical protein